MHHKDGLVKALVKEIEQEKNYVLEKEIETIYFGGGTPSLLEISPARLRHSGGDFGFLISELFKHYAVSKNAEITLEANPDDINTEKLKSWKDAGINRLSIGVQSFLKKS